MITQVGSSLTNLIFHQLHMTNIEPGKVGDGARDKIFLCIALLAVFAIRIEKTELVTYPGVKDRVDEPVTAIGKCNGLSFAPSRLRK